ncbi:hypothetical protein B0T26DRAFT_521371 [Lasiosphaeria miniovina]|uniref:Uncharacterized protein n=1 Tax=Lasiosphaeria miniovina TaxID=1954250 RepID=A0AA40DHR9_9PEZI|nr:uncharacterized protein B0T26DRAFT_521371 [Lasiosphaeria miniovina]KAK0704029.1 hypothetical protein B0T26DRAFT_521371 [Lasiosphaeria miniovina]
MLVLLRLLSIRPSHRDTEQPPTSIASFTTTSTNQPPTQARLCLPIRLPPRPASALPIDASVFSVGHSYGIFPWSALKETSLAAPCRLVHPTESSSQAAVSMAPEVPRLGSKGVWGLDGRFHHKRPRSVRKTTATGSGSPPQRERAALYHSPSDVNQNKSAKDMETVILFTIVFYCFPSDPETSAARHPLLEQFGVRFATNSRPYRHQRRRTAAVLA